MELRSTGNPDTSNPVTMSMLEYLRKKGIEAMSGICKYPESVCPHMIVLKGKLYCDATPCQFTGELPKQSNADRIRGMDDEELAKFLLDFNQCGVCGQFDKDSGKCNELSKFICTKGYRELVAYEWLKQPVED